MERRQSDLESAAGPIDRFSGEFEFLSNFYPSPLNFRGGEYFSAEHAYQAAKAESVELRERIRLCGSPDEAKILGSAIPVRPGWTESRLEVMAEILAAKFSPPSPLAQPLLATGSRLLVEGNDWGDSFWGTVEGRGENHLGRLLMEIRTVIRSASSPERSPSRP